MSRRSALLGLVLLLVGAAGWWWWSSRSPVSTPVDEVLAVAELPPIEPPKRAALDAAPCRASGRVVRASDGTGVADAFVLLQQPRVTGAPEPIVVHTDDTGQWTAADLQPGRWTVTATAASLAPTALRSLVFAPGKDHGGLDLVLADAHAQLIGTVRDVTGTPIAGARIELSRTVDRNTGSLAAFATLTDREGRYHLGVEHDAYYARVVHRDHVGAVARISITGDGARTRDFALAPGGVIRGRVLSRVDGTPVQGAVVRRQLGSGGLAMGGQPNTDHEAHAIAGEDGSFELRGLSAGSADLVASGPGSTSVEPTSVLLGVAETVEGIELLVDVGYTVAGYVVAADDDTIGIAGATVTMLDFTDFTRARVSDPSGEDGSFHIHGLLPGHYTLIVFGDDVVPNMKQSVDVGTTDADDVLVRATRGDYVRGRIDPPGAATVRLAVPMPASENGADMAHLMERLMGTFRAVGTASDGSFTIGPVLPGAYRIEADGSDARGRLDVVIAEHGGEIVVPMARGLVVSGKVRDPDGTPVPGVTVSFTSTAKNQAVSLAVAAATLPGAAVVGDDGTFTIGGLAPGEYTYAIADEMSMQLPWNDGEPLERRTIALDRDRELTLVLAPPKALRGRVVDEAGQPVAGAWVTAWPKLALRELQIGNTAGGPFGNKPSGPALESLHRQTSRLFAVAPVLTDPQGRFHVLGLRRELYSMSAHAARGQLRAELLERPVDEEPTLIVRPLATLHLVLADDDDLGTGIRVLLDGADTRSLSFRPARELTIERLPPGPWHVTVDAEGGGAKGDVELVGGTVGELHVDLAPWATVRGRVIAAGSGEPLSGLYPIVASRTATLGDLMARAGQMVGAMSGGANTRIDADGRFTLDRLAPGPLEVTFMALPAMEAVAILRVDDVQPGEAREVGNVEGLALASVPNGEGGTFGLELEVVGDEAQPRLLVVKSVAPRSPATKAGVRPGDRVLAIDDDDVTRFGARVVQRAFSASHLRRGSRHRLRLDRGGTALTIELTAAPTNER